MFRVWGVLGFRAYRGFLCLGFRFWEPRCAIDVNGRNQRLVEHGREIRQSCAGVLRQAPDFCFLLEILS